MSVPEITHTLKLTIAAPTFGTGDEGRILHCNITEMANRITAQKSHVRPKTESVGNLPAAMARKQNAQAQHPQAMV